MYNSRSPYPSTSPVRKSIIANTSTYARSPISYSQQLHQSQVGGKTQDLYASAYKASGGSKLVGEEVDLWKSRCNELESSLCQANTDLELAHFRTRKTQELENKIEELLRINSSIAGENENLAKTAGQKKSESDIWRQKYESQMNNLISLKSSYEAEMKRVNLENSRLRDELKQGDIDKVRESEDSRFKTSTDAYEKLEVMRKSHVENIELYEEQIKKLRNIVEDREREIAKLSSRFSQAKYDGSSEAHRLNEDREKLKMKISELELESAIEVDNLRSKLDNQSADQLDSLKRLHDNELEVLVGEIHKLRGLLDVKTREIEALIDQNRGLKRNFDEETHNLRQEANQLKERIAENNEFANREIAILQDQLSNQHTTDIQGLKFHHENAVEALNREILELKGILTGKNDEINNQIREKQYVRDNLSLEIDRLVNETEQWKVKQQVLGRIRAQESEEAGLKYDQLNVHQNMFANTQKDQIKYLEEEIENLKRLLHAKNLEIDTNRDQQSEIRKGLEADLVNAITEIDSQKRKVFSLQQSTDIQVKEIKLSLTVAETKALEQKKQLEIVIKHQTEDILRLKDTLEIKEKEVSNHLKHRELQDREIKRLKNENESSSEHIRRLERLKAKELEDLRARLENQNSLVIETMKSSHQNQVDIMQLEIQDLKQICALKEIELNDLFDKYDRLESAIGEYKYNAEKVKEHQSQIQALGTEIIHNKSIYDSYSKSKQARYPSSAHKNA